MEGQGASASDFSQLQQITTFAQNSVSKFSEADFHLNTRERICIKQDDPTIVLFCDNSTISDCAEMWLLVAMSTNGPQVAVCNLSDCPNMRKAMAELSGKKSHPLSWAACTKVPFILTYRESWPVAFYNGEKTAGALLSYCDELACDGNYVERWQGDDIRIEDHRTSSSLSYRSYAGTN